MSVNTWWCGYMIRPQGSPPTTPPCLLVQLVPTTLLHPSPWSSHLSYHGGSEKLLLQVFAIKSQALAAADGAVATLRLDHDCLFLVVGLWRPLLLWEQWCIKDYVLSGVKLWCSRTLWAPSSHDSGPLQHLPIIKLIFLSPPCVSVSQLAVNSGTERGFIYWVPSNAKRAQLGRIGKHRRGLCEHGLPPLSLFPLK